MTIGEWLDQWLDSVAPDVFTHGDCRKGIEVLRKDALEMSERAELSTALETRVAGGWLQRTNGQGAGKRNFYTIRKRPTTKTPERPKFRSTDELEQLEVATEVLRTLRGVKEAGEVVTALSGARLHIHTSELWKRLTKRLRISPEFTQEAFKSVLTWIPTYLLQYGLAEVFDSGNVVWRPSILDDMPDEHFPALAAHIKKTTTAECRRISSRYDSEKEKQLLERARTPSLLRAI